MCILPLHMAGLVSMWTLYVLGVARSPNQGRIEGGLPETNRVVSSHSRSAVKVVPSRITSRSACRSSGYFATGLQKLKP